MSAITVGGSIPSGVNTLEKLLAWAGYAYHFYNKGVQRQLPSDVAPGSIAEAAIVTDVNNQPCLIIRATIPLSENYITNTGKLWTDALEVSNVAIGSQFTTN